MRAIDRRGGGETSEGAGRTERRITRLREAILRRQPDLHVVLENVHDPHNVSAVVRTCDAVGVDTIHLLYYRESFPQLETTSSSGAAKWANLVRHTSVDDCFRTLRSAGCRIYATSLTDTSESLFEADLTTPVALVFGNEHRGVSNEAVLAADGAIEIPMVGLIQSLNISVACAVTLYEAMRQRLERGMYDRSALSDVEVERRLTEWSKR